MITPAFIAKWETKYDEIESDEPEYQRLVEAVDAEAEREQTLTHETFIDILDWKAARVKARPTGTKTAWTEPPIGPAWTG